MQITLDFKDGGTPDTAKGKFDYFFVRCKSKHDKKIRVFGAYYLNAYELHYEWGCSKCEDIGEDKCPMVTGNGCPTTGWFSETSSDADETFYETLGGEVIGFAEQPEPATS